MTAHRPSRRLTLAALAVLPAIPFGVRAFAMDRTNSGDDDMNMHATISPALTRAIWEKAQARHQAAIAASDKYDAEVYEPAYRELERRAPRPDMTLHVPLVDGTTHTEHLIPGFIDSYCEGSRFGALAVPFRDAWNAYLAQNAEAERDLGWAEIEKRHLALVQRMCAGHEALMKMPAPDLAALRWKLEQTIEPTEDGDIVQFRDEIRMAIVADYARLLPADDVRRYPREDGASAAALGTAA